MWGFRHHASEIELRASSDRLCTQTVAEVSRLWVGRVAHQLDDLDPVNLDHEDCSCISLDGWFGQDRTVGHALLVFTPIPPSERQRLLARGVEANSFDPDAFITSGRGDEDISDNEQWLIDHLE